MMNTVMTMSLVVRLRHRDLPKVTQLVKVRDRMQTQVDPIPKTLGTTMHTQAATCTFAIHTKITPK